MDEDNNCDTPNINSNQNTQNDEIPENFVDENEPPKAKKSKKDEWKRPKNFNLRMKGESYLGFTATGHQTKKRRGRTMKPLCCSSKCEKSF